MKVKGQFKCPWCGRMVRYSKSNRIEPHVQSTAVKCVGVGQPKHQVDWLIAQQSKRAPRKT